MGKIPSVLHQLPASQEREDKRLFNPYITGIGRSFRSSAVTFCTMITFTLYRNEEGGQIGKVLSVLHQLQTSEEGEERRLFNPS